MKRATTMFAFLALASLLLAACGGGGSDTAGAGDAARGKALYEQTVIGQNAAPGCSTCHSTEPGKTLVGPSHADIATIAATAESGKSAEEFLKESIVTPDAVVTEGFIAGIMYQNYAQDLSEQEINDLVAYLMTMK